MNVILDIGNVICEWNPQKLIAGIFTEANERQEALTSIIQHSDWLALDRGIIEIPEAIENASKRCSLDPAHIEALYKATPESLVPISSMVKAIRDLASRGIPLYVLSNMQRHSWEYLAKTYDFWAYFEGIVVSYQINLIKPDREIFEHITNRYKLSRENTIFLDDAIENVKAAEKFGMKAIHVPEYGLGHRILYRALQLHE